MNIIKLTEGLKDSTEGLQGCAVLARPLVSELKAHKLSLEEEKASPTKKYLFLLGFGVLNVLEKWKDIKDDVMGVKNGIVEIAQAIKEPGLTDEQFKKEKEKIEDKQRAKCAALPLKEVEVKDTVTNAVTPITTNPSVANTTVTPQQSQPTSPIQGEDQNPKQSRN